MKYNNTDNTFFEEVRACVYKEMASQGKTHYGTTELFIKAGIIFLATIGTYVLILYTGSLWYWGFLGICFALIGFNVMHDASHGVFSKNKFINECARRSLECMGASSVLWKTKHVTLHHSFVNTVDDDDVSYGAVLRVLLSHTPKSWHRLQHWYAFPLYTLLYFLWVFYFDIKKYLKKEVHGKKVSFSLLEHMFFWGSKMCYVGIIIIIPALVHGWLNALAGYVIMAGICGLLISTVFQLAHITESSPFSTPKENGIIAMSWAESQVRETCDFAQHSWLLTKLLGGLNFQIEHHLFPNISHVHYSSIAPTVQRICQKRNIPYTTHSFLGAIISHIRTLKKKGTLSP